MKTRELSINLLVMTLSSILLLFAIELTLRATGIQTIKPNPPKIYQTNPNPKISYELKPNMREKAFRHVITTNSLGLRSPEPDTTKPLLAVLGDSIAFGHGVADNESLPAKLQELLPTYSVQNGGVPGYNLTQETESFREKLLPLSPELLILVFYFNDLYHGTAWLDEDGVLRPEEYEPQEEQCTPIETGILGLLPGKCWLDDHSALYRFMEKMINTRSSREHFEEKAQEVREKPEENADPITIEQLDDYEEELKALAALLPKNLPRVFVIWPDNLPHTTSRVVLQEIVQEQGFRVIDLYSAFPNGLETLSWDYTHPTATAIENVAALIKKTMQEQDLL